MTNGNLLEKKASGRNNHVLEEQDPLLPIKQGEYEGFSEFKGASFGGAVFNLSTAIVGAGIMSLPATVKVLGMVPGILVIIFMALLTEASIELLMRFSRRGKTVSYGGVMGDAFGRTGEVLYQICIIVNNVGVMVVYLIIIGDVLSGTSSDGVVHPGVLEGWFGDHWWNRRFFVLLVTTLLVLSPLASFKRIDSLRYTSTLSIALAVVFVIVTAGIAIFKMVNGRIAMPRLFPDLPDLASIWKLFTVVPVLVTAYICHYNVHSIDNELKDSSRIKDIVQIALLLCSTVYVATGLFGFLIFGESTLHDVLANFDSNLGIPYSSFLSDLVRVSFVFHLMLVFPVIFYALRINLDFLLFPSARPLSSDNLRFTSITVVLLCIIFLAANFIPSIWDAFQFTGATAGVCIGFIFPAAITLRDIHVIATRWDKILAVFMIVLAVISNAIAIYSDAVSIFNKNTDSPHS